MNALHLNSSFSSTGFTTRIVLYTVRVMLFIFLVVTLQVIGRGQSPVPQTTPQASDFVARQDCFPFERLSPVEREKAEALLLKALDSEALYTIIGNLKPMSSGFGEMRFPVKKMDLPQLAERRRILATWRCGDNLTA